MKRVLTLPAVFALTATTAVNAATVCEVPNEDRRFVFVGDSAIIEVKIGNGKTDSTHLTCIQVGHAAPTCGHREGNSQTILSVIDDRTLVLTVAGFTDVTFAPVSIVYRDVICKEI